MWESRSSPRLQTDGRSRKTSTVLFLPLWDKKLKAWRMPPALSFRLRSETAWRNLKQISPLALLGRDDNVWRSVEMTMSEVVLIECVQLLSEQGVQFDFLLDK